MHSGYGKKEVLKGITFGVRAGSIVAMIGPNGSGKSTVLKTFFGLLKAWDGTIEFAGESCVGQKPSDLIGRGLVYVPQGNRVYSDLTVQENLTVSLKGVTRAETLSRLDEMAGLFPAVHEFMLKLAGKLSGGEKQQVMLATGLMKKPKMLLLDEPSLGLAPNLSAEVFKRLKEINEDMGVTILLVEHKVREVFKIADLIFGMRRGEIVAQGTPDFFNKARLKNLFLE